ncbi:MAG: TetR/AcrR family transcriptional regulator, partial [Burkholderiales bacterium]|nr:TetR/AcrR family transcriptional regulator [Burkholderiales bacterium]
MASEGVRVSAATRRKPRQSRARASSEALQEAFVRVLIERGFAGVTVREVAAVAGVGIGTFYEYVANKEALAALTIHMRVKALAQALNDCIERHRGQALRMLVSALIDEQVTRVMDEAEPWSALFMLERQVSTPEAYRKHYAQFVD